MAVIKRTIHDVYPFISSSGRLADAVKGKTVLITGGGKGIGRAITKHFAIAGASKIWITGRDTDALEQTIQEVQQAASTCTVEPVAADHTSTEEVENIFKALHSTPDILINNAGVSLSQKHIADSDPLKWWTDWEVNVKGVYLMTRAWLRALNDKPGIVISTSSSVGDLAAPNMSSYGTSKAALNRLTEIVQLEYGKQGVRALAFHPGGIASTGMGQSAPQQYRHRLNDTVDLAACTALYLATPEASYLDGRFVYSNWNLEEVEKLKDEIINDDLLVSRIKYGSHLSPELA